jgi:pyrimidine operon attenuation protein/uracil phosphoribosyltransferase
MRSIARNAFGITEEGLASETARIFGFQRRGPKITKAMHQAIEHLEENNEIRIVDNKVQVLGG